jgi:hypothetical protein
MFQGVETMAHFDTRVSVEERFPDRFAPMSYAEQVASMTPEQRSVFDSTNRSIVVFSVLVVLMIALGVVGIAYTLFTHLSR